MRIRKSKDQATMIDVTRDRLYLKSRFMLVAVILSILGAATFALFSPLTSDRNLEYGQNESQDPARYTLVAPRRQEPITTYLIREPAETPVIGDDDVDHVAALTLRGSLDHPNVAVREDAVEALGEIYGSHGIEGLAYALSDESTIIRQAAIETLADLGSNDAVAALAWTLHDRDADLRALAVEELSEFGTESAALLLQQFAADPDPTVRAIACEARGVDWRLSDCR
ncbi:MAG: HEAT repeat domain-containing protein [Woeseiaceae bacterium]